MTPEWIQNEIDRRFEAQEKRIDELSKKVDTLTATIQEMTAGIKALRWVGIIVLAVITLLKTGDLTVFKDVIK